MKWILWTILSLVAGVGVIALIGYFLPVGHVASRSAEFNKSPDQVFPLFADPDSYHRWWDAATVKSEVVEHVPPTKVVTRVVGETQFGGTWTIDIAATQGGSRVTITERGEIYNVIFRTLSKFVFGYESTMENCLTAAQKAVTR